MSLMLFYLPDSYRYCKGFGRLFICEVWVIDKLLILFLRSDECESNQNSHVALWEEYKEVSSPIPLMNIIRRILEYYFLQLCGYEGESLRKRILEDHKEDFICDDDYTKFDMASSMLSYISSTAHGINDDMHYVDDYSDTDMCRDTFRMIFRHMGQEQHFEMMVSTT